MRYFLKLLGTAEHHLPNFWAQDRPDLLKYVRFGETRDPTGTISRGDRLIYYATGWQRVFAIAQVRSEAAYNKPGLGEENWPLAMDVFVEQKIGRLEQAPSAQVLALSAVQEQGKAQASFVELRDDQYEKALAALGGQA